MAIDSLTAGEGGLLGRIYGEHVINGHLILNRTTEPRALMIALGEGTWDGVVKLWYRGEPLQPDAFNFHPGAQSSSTTDPVQGIDEFFPGGLTYSTTAYISVRVPTTEESVDPGQLIGRYRCQVVPDYDMQGNLTGTTYSSNPARVLIDILINQGNITPSRIDWASWYDWKIYCDSLIEWNDGTSVRQIKRFEAHYAMTGPVDTTRALNDLTELSASFWQDDGELIYFAPVESRSPLISLDKSNIVKGSYNHAPLDVRQQPTRLTVSFRDLDSEFLVPASFPAKDEPGIDQRGVIYAPGSFQFGGMTYSQAQRLGKYWLRRSQAAERVGCRVSGDTIALLPGDLVNFTHEGFRHETRTVCHVMAIEDESASADTRRLEIAPWGEMYRDVLDQEPIPATLTV
jgi:hypothetical protein